MNGTDLQQNETIELDLTRIFHSVMDRIWTVVMVAVACGAVAFFATLFFITPQYQAKAMFYVNNSNLSLGDTSVSISSGDLTTSRNLVDSYIVILNSRETLMSVIDYADISRSYTEVRKMISAEAVNKTEIFRVTVTSSDPKEAETIANAIAYVLPKRIGTIIDGTSAKVVDSAIKPTNPSSPSYTKNAVIGFLLGLLVTVGTIAVREVLDITIRTEEDISRSCKHPILVAVPDMMTPGKGGSSYAVNSKNEANRKKGKYTTAKKLVKHAIMGPDISFAASEAYKMLRTKLQFSFTDENNCRVIGLSSAMSGEGKSLTAVNLAFTLSQLNQKVLLVDCDMRRPTLAEKLDLLKQPGLSSYLTRQCELNDLLQLCGIKDNEDAFHVISAGQNPPNPIELLSSERMKTAVEIMRETYDYVILDLPPVGEVSDAMAVAKQTDGILLVARQNYCNRIMLADTVRQFEFVNAKILGVVFNCISDRGSKGYYKSYYKKYGSSYADNNRSVSRADRGRK